MLWLQQPEAYHQANAPRNTWSERVDAQASAFSLPSVPTREPSEVIIKLENEVKEELVDKDSCVDVDLETEIEAEEGWLLASWMEGVVFGV